VEASIEVAAEATVDAIVEPAEEEN
jgi:hypothetical protein